MRKIWLFVGISFRTLRFCLNSELFGKMWIAFLVVMLQLCLGGILGSAFRVAGLRFDAIFADMVATVARPGNHTTNGGIVLRRLFNVEPGNMLRLYLLRLNLLSLDVGLVGEAQNAVSCLSTSTVFSSTFGL